jgi:hypothetical protein
VLALPFVGFHQFMTGDQANWFDGGPRVGALFGWRLNDAVSLNVEGLFDRLNPQPRLAPAPAHPWVREIAFSPLFHFIRDRAEVFIGPVLGYWFLADHYESGSEQIKRGRGLGFNAGALLQTAMGVSWGVMIDYQSRQAGKDSEQILGICLAALL